MTRERHPAAADAISYAVPEQVETGVEHSAHFGMTTYEAAMSRTAMKRQRDGPALQRYREVIGSHVTANCEHQFSLLTDRHDRSDDGTWIGICAST